MSHTYELINRYLVTIFNNILDIEETSLKISEFSDLSIKEMHTIEAIGLHNELTSTEVAKRLNITVGTLTIAINNLVRKGYVERIRLTEDRRVVRLILTKKGKLLFRIHAHFHREMVEKTLKGLSREETVILIKGLENLHSFLQHKLIEQRDELKNT